MATYFTYKGIYNQTGKIIRGRIEAPTEMAVEQILSESNITLITAKEEKQSKLMAVISKYTGKIKPKEVISMFVTLEQFERAGVPLLDSLGDLKDFSSNVKMKDMMQDIYEAVKGGSLLSDAMKKYSTLFGDVNISLVAMGEKTGELANSFKNIADNLKWDLEIKRKISKAIMGPMFQLGLLVVIAVVMLKVVVPKVLTFILDQEIAIPSYTTALINTSNFVEKYFFLIVAVIVGIFVSIKIFRRASNTFKVKMDFIKLKVPIVGAVMQKIDLSRFSKFFGITFASGIPVLECITIAKAIVSNFYVKDEIETIKQKVSDGSSMAKALAESTIFPFIVQRMFKVGEESGDIKNAMENIDYFYESEINDGIELIVSSIKPIMLFVIGGLLSWVIVAVFGPIYGNFANIV